MDAPQHASMRRTSASGISARRSFVNFNPQSELRAPSSRRASARRGPPGSSQADRFEDSAHHVDAAVEMSAEQSCSAA